jgi:hypothetical protein
MSAKLGKTNDYLGLSSNTHSQLQSMLPARRGGCNQTRNRSRHAHDETRVELEDATPREAAGLEKRPEAFLSENEYRMTVEKARCYFVTPWYRG